MRYVPFFIFVAFLGAAFFSCQPTRMVKKSVPIPPVVKPLALPDSATVQVARENVRETPNGHVWGKLKRGQKIALERRIGNWVLFNNAKYDSAFIWAPSVGLPYINLYNPGTYWDTTSHRFYPLPYFKSFLGDGIIKKESAGEYQLFFGDLGLGSHRETIVEVVHESVQTVRHGVTLYVRRADQAVEKVRIDFFRPVKGVRKVLKKCGLPYRPPTDQDDARVRWANGSLFPGLTMEAERKEWKSEWFTDIWLIPAGRKK